MTQIIPQHQIKNFEIAVRASSIFTLCDTRVRWRATIL
jgi:hypothetical protein